MTASTGFAYSMAALDMLPGSDRGMQLAAHYAREMGRSSEVLPRWTAYLNANPDGPLADEARRELGLPEGGSVARLPNSDEGSSEAAPAARAEAPEPQEPSQSSFRNDQVIRALEEASALVAKNQKPQALAKYREVLALDPAHPEALSWVEDYLRQKRQYAELRDVLMQAARSPSASTETRKQQLLEVAGLCESQLRDLETAILAWKQDLRDGPRRRFGARTSAASARTGGALGRARRDPRARSVVCAGYRRQNRYREEAGAAA